MKGSSKIQRNDSSPVNGHQQQTEQLVVEAVHVLVVVGVVVELGMVVGLHEAAAGEIVDHGGNARNGDGKIVRPGLDGGGDPGFLGIALCQLREIFQKFLQKIHIFVGAADSCPGAVGKGRQLEIQVGNDLPPPFGMHGKHLLISAGGPVELRIRHAPFLRRHGAEKDGVLRLPAGLYQCFAHAQHHGNGGVIVLKAVKIGVVVGGEHDLPVRVPAGQLADDVVGGAVALHPGAGVQRDGHRRTVRKQLLQHPGVLPGNGKGGGFGRACDILRVQRGIVHLAVAPGLHGDQRCRTLEVGLIHGVVDPPFVPLIDLHQHQLSGDVQPLVIRFCALARIDKLVGGRAVRDEIRLIRPQLDMALPSLGVGKRQLRFLKLPRVHGDGVLPYFGKADFLHLRRQHVSRGDLRRGACGAVAQHGVGAVLLHPLCKAVGIADIQPFQIPLRLTCQGHHLLFSRFWEL